MHRCLVCSCLVVAACNTRVIDQPPDTTVPETVDVGLDLEWSMQRIGDELRIEYTVVNRLDRPVWIMDRLWEQRAEAVVVHDAPERATVAFTRGFVDHHTDWKILDGPPAPLARRLDPKSAIDGVATTPTPLKSWLNYLYIKPLEPGALYGILEIGYCDGPETKCTFRGIDPSLIFGGPQKLLRGARLPLPEGTASWIPLPPSRGWYHYVHMFDDAPPLKPRRSR